MVSLKKEPHKAKTNQPTEELAGVGDSPSSKAQPNNKIYTSDDIAAAMKKLTELRDMGILTEDEVLAKKKNLLHGISFDTMMDLFFKKKVDIFESNNNAVSSTAEILATLKSDFVIKSIYFSGGDEKATQKIEKAVNAYGPKKSENVTVLGCQDETVFGGCGDGCIFTIKGIYINGIFSKNKYIAYKDVKEIRLDEKEDHVVYINDIKVTTIQTSKNREKFCDMIRFLCDKLGNVKVP